MTEQQDGTNMLVEALETRIAPAGVTIFAGHPDASRATDIDFDQSPFLPASAASADPDISAMFGAATNSYVLKLSAGDTLRLFTFGDGYQPFITVTSGEVLAFFFDKDINDPDGAGVEPAQHNVDADELTGLALSKGAVVSVAGSVDGDIITNYNGLTHLLDSDNTLGELQNIGSLSVGGNVSGSIISGGAMKSINVAGSVGAILTGSAANGYAYDFNALDGGGSEILSVVPAAKKAGSSITDVTVGSIVDRIETGRGGAGAAGGAISNVTVVNDTDGFAITSGAGGDGVAGNTKGGAGGAVSTIFVRGQQDEMDLSLHTLVSVSSGDGGAGFGTGAGGAGGSLQKVYVGYDIASGNKPVLSTSSFKYAVLVESGQGGNGGSGGAGGAVTDVRIGTSTPDEAASYDELQVIGGNGGNISAVSGSKAGAGGSLKTILVQNFDATTDDSDIVIKGGTGGTFLASNKGAGGAGGSITDLFLLGNELSILAGDGLAGTSLGGKGGSIANVTVSSSELVIPHNLIMNAGRGGNVTVKGTGGDGGNISDVVMLRAQLEDPNNAVAAGVTINGGLQGDAGNSANGAGGRGGSVSDVQILDEHEATFTPTGFADAIAIRSGIGGNGTSKGGAGGAISVVTILASEVNFSMNTGMGGSASAGSGAAGGSATGVSVVVTGQVLSADVVASITTGAGGNGTGSAAAGAGGAMKTVSLAADGQATAFAGDGGSTGTGAVGSGGAISVINLSSENNSVSATSGDAGTVGGKAGAGGAIVSASLLAALDITLQSGDGHFGGAGGSITTVGYAGSVVQQAPTGDILIKAGSGSSFKSAAGVGGSITNVTGYVSAGYNSTTVFEAGNGGSSLLPGDVGAAGGSVNGVNILGGGHVAETFTITIDSFTTPALPFDATTAQIQAALDFALGSNKVLATRGLNPLASTDPRKEEVAGAIVITFTGNGTYDETDMPDISVVTSVVTPDGVVMQSTLVTGGTDVDEVQAFRLPTFSEFKLSAGDGGNSTTSKAGGNGGNVTDVHAQPFYGLFKSIRAGDAGSSGLGKGGAGGSIDQVFVGNDIGLRVTAQGFGYETMGGLFAGMGGIGKSSMVTPPGPSSPIHGLNGNVTNVSADFIASIVAGTNTAGIGYVTKVDGIKLTGLVASTTDGMGHFTNFLVANTVGGVDDPNEANATTYDVFDPTGVLPSDGLIAAVTLTQNRNFRPEMFLTATLAMNLTDATPVDPQ